MFCGKCSVTKRVAVETSSHHVVRKSIVFCLTCFLAAKKLPARAVAEAEWMDRSTRSRTVS